MKQLKKAILLLIVTVLFTTNFVSILGKNTVKAAIFPINEAQLYSKGEVVLFEYDNIGIGVEVTVYKKDGVEYPVYCLNKGKQGITKEHEYSVEVNQMLSNQNIWRAIVNGYPFKTPKELGCNNMEEAYAATKMAVYDAMYHYDLEKFTIHHDEESNKRVVAAIKNIITAARNSNQTKVAATLQIQEINEKWEVDKINKNYVSKTYKVTTSATSEKYEISISGKNSNSFKITDVNNKEKKQFASNEQFKILLPIAELEEEGEFEIHANSSLKTMPVFYGKSPNQNWQNFAVTGGSYEIAEINYKQTYKENKTKIEIQKKDGDTELPLEGAVFNLLNENKEIVYSELTTNNQGTIEIPNLLPGNYYLKETKAPEGYYGYNEIIPVEIKLQEKLVVKVDNFKEPGEKEVPEEPKEQKISVSKKLPRTGF